MKWLSSLGDFGFLEFILIEFSVLISESGFGGSVILVGFPELRVRRQILAGIFYQKFEEFSEEKFNRL
jgi:hypothetical protein